MPNKGYRVLVLQERGTLFRHLFILSFSASSKHFFRLYCVRRLCAMLWGDSDNKYHSLCLKKLTWTADIKDLSNVMAIVFSSHSAKDLPTFC